MARKVEFQGSVHEFPDTATDDQIRTALQGGQPKQAPAEGPGFFKGLYDTTIGPTVEALTHPKETMLGIAGRTADALKHPIDTLKNAAASGAAHAMLPVPDEILQRDLPTAAGKATGTVLSMAGPELAEGLRLPGIKNPNPTEAAALDYLQKQNVPVPAGARTGNAFVKNVQKAADSTPLGAMVAKSAEKATTEGLGKAADALAGRANPQPVVPEQAGAGLRDALGKKAAARAAEADQAYADFRDIEQRPSSTATIQTGSKPSTSRLVDANGRPITADVPVTENVKFATDVKGIKERIQPIFEDMQKWMEPAKRNASAGFQAMKSILDGPDVIPASQAEAGLGGLKALARESGGRNAGLAKFIIPDLQKTIDGAVSSVDPSAMDALHKGRAATAAQYGTQGILDQLRAEPVQTFGQMTYAKDAGIDLLRKVGQEAPAELPKIGRAYLEDLFGKATSQGGFGGADGLWSKWQNLGPQTKKLLFQDGGLVSDLDKFFLGAKKLAENPNPSGSAVVGISSGTGALIFTHPATGVPLAIGAGALSKMLHSEVGVRALTEGMKLPLSAPAAALRAGQILKMAGKDVTPVELPKAASDQSQQSDLLAAAQGRQ